MAYICLSCCDFDVFVYRFLYFTIPLIKESVLSYSAHSSAIIDDGAQIGANTKIWHFTHVCGGAKIGEKCSLGQNVLLAMMLKSAIM